MEFLCMLVRGVEVNSHAVSLVVKKFKEFLKLQAQMFREQCRVLLRAKMDQMWWIARSRSTKTRYVNDKGKVK